MGFVSRKIFPTCGSMCICCPALRTRSRQPVKRYKKLLAEIFNKSLDGPPNERRIVKLCEYAVKNPFRIPKIAKYLEERCYKEIRCENIRCIVVVSETYDRLLCMCKEQMSYFAVNLLNVIAELINNSKQDAVRILGCQIMTRFIYCQTDGIFMHNIDNMVLKVCKLAREVGDDNQKRCLRAAGLQCLSAMVWFMTEFSTIFIGLDEIVNATLDSYVKEMLSEDDGVRSGPHHNWVDEVVRCDGRGGAASGNVYGPNGMIARPQLGKKDPSLLTREDIETPKIWVQVCIQRLAELAKESSTMRLILEPMFVYFDSGRHWISSQGLAMLVLSDMSNSVEASGNPQFILSAVIRHLDHKNVVRDLQVKSYVVQVAACLAQQIRSGLVLTEFGCVSDLCRHLRKSLQASVESVGEQELNLNVSLQHSIEDCLLEIIKGIDDAGPLLNMMTMTLEKLPSLGVVSRATISSLIVLSHTISSVSVAWHSQQAFPEALLVQLLKVMSHPDVETRAGAHQIFCALLVPASKNYRHDAANSFGPRRWNSSTTSAFNSITALLEKLRKEKDAIQLEQHGNTVQVENSKKEIADKEQKAQPCKTSPNFLKFSSIAGMKAAQSCFDEPESFAIKFSKDQIAQLLSGFWVQAILPDNIPLNFEAIGHSFSLTIIASHLKFPNETLAIRFFQLPFSLRSIPFGPNSGILPPARQRSVLVLSTGMLMFAAKIYHIPKAIDLLKSGGPCDVDPYVGINNESQAYIKPGMDGRNYGSFSDNQAAAALLFELRSQIYESDLMILDIVAENLCSIMKVEVGELSKKLSDAFTPDDAFMFGPQSILDSAHIQMAQSEQSLSFDGDFQTDSPAEDDAIGDSFIPERPRSPPASHIMSIGQLMESALEVAGQVAGACVSNSPLPYSTMASQCEALGTGTKMRLSTWLTHDNNRSARAVDTSIQAVPADVESLMEKISNGSGSRALLPLEPWLAVRLPPASPFDNFLRAARY